MILNLPILGQNIVFTIACLKQFFKLHSLTRIIVEVIQRAQYEEWSTDMEGGRTQKALREFLMDLPKVGNRSFHIALDLLKEQQRWIYDTLGKTQKDLNTNKIRMGQINS